MVLQDTWLFEGTLRENIAIRIVEKMIKTEITKNTAARTIPPVLATLAHEVIVLISAWFTS